MTDATERAMNKKGTQMSEKTRNRRLKSIREQCDKCRHFTGIGNNADGSRRDFKDGRGSCAANVKYDDVIKKGARMIALPCFPPEADNMPADGVWPTCPKQSFKTAEELDAEAAEIEAESKRFMERMMIVRPAIFKHAGWEDRASTDEEFYGLKKKFPDRKDARGKFACPICKTGELLYSIASYNGHVRAQCTSKGCVAWME